MSDTVTVGEAIVAFLEACNVSATFGVISIHNMPILDALAERGKLRYVPARGEAGAVNMADAATRVTGRTAVAFTSTGTACGNAAGAMVEAQTAGTPLLHITGQIEVAYLDRNCAYIHEARDQLAMLKSVSKAAFRVLSPENAVPILREAMRIAHTAPAGPVSVEIPIDIQQARIPMPKDLAPLPVASAGVDQTALDALVDSLASARRPLLWLGGGARSAGKAVERLIALGVGVVTSTQGRGIVPEDHPMNLGAYTTAKAVESFYQTCDAMVAVGTRLRGNETLKYSLKLPRPLYRVDADAMAEGRGYIGDRFVCGDANEVLTILADRLEGRLNVDPSFAADLTAAKQEAEADLREGLGPYTDLVSALQEVAGRDFLWVRDVTVSNSTWGNRGLRIYGPRDGVHALGGGIGQGMQMGIGAAVASGRRTICLVGDGGLQLNIGELATLAQERPDVTLLVMNSGGYEVIKNIQDAHYGGRRTYVDLLTPNYEMVCGSIGLPYMRIADTAQAGAVLAEAIANDGPTLVEVDMAAIGPFSRAFAGPPVRKAG